MIYLRNNSHFRFTAKFRIKASKNPHYLETLRVIKSI